MKNLIYKLTFCTIAIIAIAFNLTTSANAASPGALDFSFSNDGRILNNISVSATGVDILAQPDGKILISGIVNTGVSGNSAYVARFNVDTALDATFGSSGVSLIEFGNESSVVKIKLQTNGKIVLGCEVSAASGIDDNLVVALLNQDGSLDTSFDGDGKVTISTSANDAFSNVDVASDGKILVFGNENSVDCTVARLNINGSLDITFNGDGRHTIDLGSSNQGCFGVVQADNKIVITSTSSGGISLARLTSAGTLDTTFDADGIVAVPYPPGFTQPRGIALQSNGKILVSGVSNIGNSANDGSIIFRLNTNGTLDTTFDTDGKVEIQIDPTLFESFTDILIEPNGKITALLTTTGGGMVRFNSNGSLDSTFGLNGIHRGTNLGRNALTIQADGKLLTVGTSGTSLLVTRQVANIQPTQSGDFDGDAFTDSAVYRPSTGNWFILNSSNNTVTIDQFGTNGDIPIDGDFDGDGRCDVAIYRPSQGTWFFKRSSDATILGATFGSSTDRPIPGDYDKDGKTDMAFFRPSNGNWFVLRSSTNFGTFFAYPFGQAGDIPLTIGGL